MRLKIDKIKGVDLGTLYNMKYGWFRNNGNKKVVHYMEFSAPGQSNMSYPLTMLNRDYQTYLMRYVKFFIVDITDET